MEDSFIQIKNLFIYYCINCTLYNIYKEKPDKLQCFTCKNTILQCIYINDIQIHYNPNEIYKQRKLHNFLYQEKCYSTKLIHNASQLLDI